jgi:hypothetical protein
VNLLLDKLGRGKVSYWKLRREISSAYIVVFGSTQLVNAKAYVSLEDPGMLSHYLLLAAFSYSFVLITGSSVSFLDSIGSLCFLVLSCFIRGYLVYFLFTGVGHLFNVFTY